MPGRLIVKFRSGIAANVASELHARIGANLKRRLDDRGATQLVNVPDGATVQSVIREYEQSPAVEYAEPDYVVHAFGEPNDPLYPQQWALHNVGQTFGLVGADIKALPGWQITTGSKQVVVATLDTGIDLFHPDLVGNIYTNALDCNANGIDDDGAGYTDDCHGFDFIHNTGNPTDDSGHGTHVAGIIGAAGNNGFGVTGLNWQTQIVACKFLDNYGYGSVSGAIACLNYIGSLKNKLGVNIVASNNSWGGSTFSQALYDAIQAQASLGILFIAAAGNDFSDNDKVPVYPASYLLPNVISVAATNDRDELTYFSNRGRHTVHVSAPGDAILSTLPGATYGLASGTSMATPYVTGLAALLAAQDPSRDWKKIKNLILTGGDKLDSLSDTASGRRINVAGAMTCSNVPLQARLAPAADVVSGAVNSPITLQYLNINCAAPASSLQATVSTGETVQLLDNGGGGDLYAGDGIFTGRWTPQAPGNYSIYLPGGEALSVQVLEDYQAVPELPNYRGISGQSLEFADDAVAKLTSPFPIHFGNATFSDLYVSSNGTISFSGPFEDFYNRSLPTTTDPNQPAWNNAVTLLAPFWDDLYPIKGTQHNVFWEVQGTAPNRELIVEWRDVPFFDCASDMSATVKFQVVFQENAANHVLYEYSRATAACPAAWIRFTPNHSHGESATVGLQIASDKAVQWSYDRSTIGDSTAIGWQLASEPVSENPIPTLTSVNPPYALGPAEVPITITGTNFVAASYVAFGCSASDRLPTTYISNTQLRAIVSVPLLTQVKVSICVVNPAPGGGNSNTLPFGLGIILPSITSISPSTVVAGSPSFTLTVNGQGFSNANPATGTIYLNHTPSYPTTFISDSQLSTTVPAYYAAQPGTIKVSVAVSPLGDASNEVLLTVVPRPEPPPYYYVTDPNGASDQTSAVKINRFIGWHAGADRGSEYLEQFGRSATKLSPLSAAQVGYGTMQPSSASTAPATMPGINMRPSIPTGYIPTTIATADFNRDGRADWVIANGGDSTLWLYLGRGDGSFDIPTIIPLKGVSPTHLTVADLRGGGSKDIIVAEADSGTVGVLLGRGDGTFAPEVQYAVPAAPLFVTTADFNRDGHLDVLVGLNGTMETGPLATLCGDGKGHLGSPLTLPTHYSTLYRPAAVNWIAAGDFDGDGYPDAAVIDYDWNTDWGGVWLYHNTGDGHFKQAGSLAANGTGGPASIINLSVLTGDINEDGCLDLVYMDTLANATVMLGDCHGGFTKDSALVFGEGEIGFGAALADINGDGHLDLVTSGINVNINPAAGQESGALLSVMFGTGSGRFSRARVYRGVVDGYSLAVTDLSGDGKPDVIVVSQTADGATEFLNNGQGEFGAPDGEYLGPILGGKGPVNTPYQTVVPVDINGDGAVDLATPAPGDALATDMVVSLNNGAGRFGPPIRSRLFNTEWAWFSDCVFGDFRNSGHLDAVLAGQAEGPMSLFFAIGNGNGSFAPPTTISTDRPPAYLALGDLNGDGKLDIVGTTTASDNSPALGVFLGRGDGTFSQLPPVPYATANGGVGAPVAIYARDFNRDGKLDVMISTEYGTVFELLGIGDGTFTSPRALLTGMAGFRLTEVDQDGYLDLVEFGMKADHSGSAEICVYQGQADASLVSSSCYEPYRGVLDDLYSTSSPFGRWADSRVADYDGDGIPDIAIFQQPYAYGTVRRSLLSYVQFMKGVGEGTFVPGQEVFPSGEFVHARSAVDVNGDGRQELLEWDGVTFSFNVTPVVAAPALQIALLENPVAGNRGGVRVRLNTAASSPVSVTLTTPSPGISLPSSVVIPAGSVLMDIPFAIVAGFDSSHPFVIRAQLGADTAIVYGTHPDAVTSGFYPTATVSSATVYPGQTAAGYDVFISSLGSYTGTVRLRCESLPQDTACNLSGGEVALVSGQTALVPLQVSTSGKTVPGTYTFMLIAWDDSSEQRLQLQLLVKNYDGSSLATVTTLAPAEVGGATAVLNGTVVSNTSTSTWFEYGTSSDLRSYSSTPFDACGWCNYPLSARLTGLMPSTTYYYRLRAVTAGGISDGQIVSFMTAHLPRADRRHRQAIRKRTLSGTAYVLPALDQPGAASLSSAPAEDTRHRPPSSNQKRRARANPAEAPQRRVESNGESLGNTASAAAGDQPHRPAARNKRRRTAPD